MKDGLWLLYNFRPSLQLGQIGLDNVKRYLFYKIEYYHRRTNILSLLCILIVLGGSEVEDAALDLPFPGYMLEYHGCFANYLWSA